MPRGRQHVFNHPQAEREAELEPHREGNDFSGESGGDGRADHGWSCPFIAYQTPSSVNLTMPVLSHGRRCQTYYERLAGVHRHTALHISLFIYFDSSKH